MWEQNRSWTEKVFAKECYSAADGAGASGGGVRSRDGKELESGRSNFGKLGWSGGMRVVPSFGDC